MAEDDEDEDDEEFTEDQKTFIQAKQKQYKKFDPVFKVSLLASFSHWPETLQSQWRIENL